MNKPFEKAIEGIMVDLENSQLGTMETEMTENISTETNKVRENLLAMVGKENVLKADDLINDIEYFNRVKAYECGFRRAMYLMMDVFCGGKQNENKE